MGKDQKATHEVLRGGGKVGKQQDIMSMEHPVEGEVTGQADILDAFEKHMSAVFNRILMKAIQLKLAPATTAVVGKTQMAYLRVEADVQVAGAGAAERRRARRASAAGDGRR